MATQFTPGPWLLGPSESPGPRRVILGPPIPNQPFTAGIIAHVYSGLADDRLITAAPELYASVDETHKWVRRIQDVMTGYLVPDGYDADEALNRLIGMLDGPEQREIQGRAFAALAKVRGEQVPA